MIPLYAKSIKGNLSSKTMGKVRLFIRNLVTLYLFLGMGFVSAGFALYNKDIFMCLSPYI